MKEPARAVFGFSPNEADVFLRIFTSPTVSQEEILGGDLVPSKTSMFKVISRVRSKLKKKCKAQIRSSQHGSYWIEPEHKRLIDAKLEEFLTQRGNDGDL